MPRRTGKASSDPAASLTRAEGVTDFDRYAYQPGTQPQADLFVDHA